MKKTISIIEPSAIYRRLLADMIESIGEYELRHVLSDVSTWELLLRDPSDFLLVEVDVLSGVNVGFGVIERLSGRCGTSCIVSTFNRSGEAVRRAFKAGAAGYVLKDSDYAEFRTNLELALHGGIPTSLVVTQMLISALGTPPSDVPSAADPSSDFVLCVEEAVEDYLRDATTSSIRNLSDYLERRMSLSYGHISTQYSRERGCTLRQYRQERRIHRAKELLRTTTYTLTEVANMLEFSSVAHLSASFKSLTGVTPSVFRHGHQPGAAISLKDASGPSRA